MARYPHDAMDDFVRALKKLPDTEEAGISVNAIIDQIVTDPFRGRANANGVRVAKLPSFKLGDGRTCPGLRAAYSVVMNRAVKADHPGRTMVILLDISLYDERLDLPASDPPPTASKTHRSH